MPIIWLSSWQAARAAISGADYYYLIVVATNVQKHFVTDYSMCCSKRFVFSCVSFTFSDSFLFGGGIVYLFNGSRPFFSILLWLSRAHCVRTHMQRRRRWRCQSFAAYSCYFSLSLFVIRPILCKSEPGAPPEHTLPPPLPPTSFGHVIGLCVYGSDVDNDGSKMERKQKKVLCLFLCERSPIRCMHMWYICSRNRG